MMRKNEHFAHNPLSGGSVNVTNALRIRNHSLPQPVRFVAFKLQPLFGLIEVVVCHIREATSERPHQVHSSGDNLLA